MSTFTDPPWLSVNTIAAAVMRLARALGLAELAVTRFAAMDNRPRRKARFFRGYTPSEHDVFVTTYFKSGTNWLMQIALEVAWRGSDALQFDHIHEIAAWPDAPVAGIIPLRDPGPWQRSPTGKRVIKTAAEADFVPYDEKAAYLTVIRDPKDVLVSSYHFFFGVFDLFDDITLDRWVELFLTPRFPAGSWAVHTASYWAWRDRPNVRVLTYPQMKADPTGAVRAVAETMGVELSAQELARVVERSSFAVMKQHEQRYAPPRMRFTRTRGTMIRAGKAGGSGELLSREQQAAIDRHMQDALRRLGSDFPYAEVFDVVEA